MVEHSAVNRRVASSNLARGAKIFQSPLSFDESVARAEFGIPARWFRKTNAEHRNIEIDFPFRRLFNYAMGYFAGLDLLFPSAQASSLHRCPC